MSTGNKSSAGPLAVAGLIVFGALTGSAMQGGATGLLAMLFATAIAGLCWKVRLQDSSGLVSPMNVILAMFGIGTFLSTFHVAAIQGMETLGVLSIAPSEVERQVFWALTLTLLALMAFVPLSRWLCARGGPEPEHVEARYPMAAANVVLVVALTGVGLYGLQEYVGTRGGLESVVAGWNDRDAEGSSFRDMMIYGLPASSLLYLSVVRNPLSFLPLAHLAGSFLALSVTGSRHEGIRLAFASFLLVWMHRGSRELLLKWRNTLAISAFVGFVAYVVVVGGYRGLASTQSRMLSAGSLMDNIREGGFGQKLLSAYYLPSVQTVATVTSIFPDRAQYMQGDSFLAAADVWVPRFIYADFPTVKLGHDLFEIVNGDAWDSALYANYVGELYANWGWTAVPLGMALLALGTSLLYRLVKPRRDLPIFRFGYAIAIGMTLPYLVTVESLHTASSALAYVATWIVVALVNLPMGRVKAQLERPTVGLPSLRPPSPAR